MGIHYFDFEKDFVEDGLRCIPMVVRMKLDSVGIKLSLRQWSQLDDDQREGLAAMPVKTHMERSAFDSLLSEQIAAHSNEPVTRLAIRPFPQWKERESVPVTLVQQAKKYDAAVSLDAWKALKPLQRFALVKLCRPGHENKNFPLAMAEFGLLKQQPELCVEQAS